MQENRMHLTPRLRTIMQQVPEGAKLADIGTDHALIPTALLRRGVIQQAIASDLREGPLDSAARTAKQFCVEDRLSLRLGGGMQTIKPEEADTIVIAGMGGETIAQILTDDPWALDGNHLLLLQAMTAQPYLRQYLAAHGGIIQKESLCREGQRIYTVMTVIGGGKPEQKSLAACCISDALLQDAMAADYMQKLLHREQNIAHSLETAKHQKSEELQMHKEMIAVLSQALQSLGKEEAQ